MSANAAPVAHTDLPIDDDKPFIPCESFEVDFFSNAPQVYVNTVELPVSADTLFEVFADPHSWPKWAPGIGEVEWTSEQPYRPGTTRTVRFWGGMAVYEDFFIYDAPREMAFRFYGTSELVWKQFGEHYKVEPTGENSCKLTWTVAYDPAGTFGKIHFLVRPTMIVNFKLYMFLLKRYCRKL